MRTGRMRSFVTALAAGTLAASTLLVSPAHAAGEQQQTHPPRGHHGQHADGVRSLTKAVKVGGVLQHLKRLQRIANHNDGTRASGTPGFADSADYVVHKMRRAGYQVTRQKFEFPFFQSRGSSFAQVSPTSTEYVEGTDYNVMDFSGSGDVAGAVVPIDVDLTPPRESSSGCEATDFAGLDLTGKVALLQRGTCTFGDKVANAENAGAAAAIIFNQGDGTPADNPDRYELFAGTLGGPVGIPTISVSYDTGAVFAGLSDLTVTITADTISETRTTENVIAQTRRGNWRNVVMAGAHLDSVVAGPGYNDNGSGTAALLEIAQELAKTKPKIRNKVRFAWWGAEESGLLGSEHYMSTLPQWQQRAIALYLNFDMIGSPNYMFGIYDGDDSDAVGEGPGPAGSAAIERTFEKFFDQRGIPHEGTDFDGRSDYGPFIAAGIPAGGLFTGAEELKTAEQVARYGGVAGAALDPCYHQACDSMTPVRDGGDADVYRQLRHGMGGLTGNVNRYALDVNSDAAAAAIATFARSTWSITREQRQS